jgi:hypothetical protein
VDERRDVVTANLRALRPDLVAFQESVVTDDYDQVARLLGAAPELKYKAALSVAYGADHRTSA